MPSDPTHATVQQSSYTDTSQAAKTTHKADMAIVVIGMSCLSRMPQHCRTKIGNPPDWQSSQRAATEFPDALRLAINLLSRFF